MIGSDGKGGTDVVWNQHAPAIESDHVAIAHNPDGSTTISGLDVSDSDPGSSTETFTVATTTDAPGSSVMTPSTGSGSLADVDTALNNGVTYNPGTTPPSTDKVTLTVTDNHGVTDTVNFVFNQAGEGPATLTGTAGKDVIFGSGNGDTLTGNGGQDQFVFSPALSGAAQHTITDFDVNLDKIDVRQFHAITASALPTETQQGNDTLITLDSNDTILLKNVVAANLHASDFILHS